MKTLKLIITCFMVSIFTLVGCTSTSPQLDTTALNSNIAAIKVPDNVRIVGLGEASHGTSEFQILKGDVFKSLVANNKARVFAIEGDFGSSLKVDQYVHGGPGTAEEAAATIGFKIYRTKEITELIQWMRTYNQTAPKGEDLHFLGFDMQSYDNNKDILMSYLKSSAPNLAQKYETKLSPLTNKTMFNLASTTASTAENDLSQLMSDMKLAIPSEKQDRAFRLALQAAQCILENTKVRQTTTEYNVLRDAMMKQKIDWIAKEFNGLIFINGHNGHIGKSPNSGYKNMGSHLAESYKDAYFAIGTDARYLEFNAGTYDNYTNFKLNNKNPITALLENTPENCYYLDFSKVAEDKSWQEVLSKPQKMLALNVMFSSWQKLFSATYTLSVVPKDTYDALVLFKNTTPTHLL